MDKKSVDIVDIKPDIFLTKQTRLNHIDLLKGAMILFIIVTHSGWTYHQRLLFGFPFWIDMAVPIFLVVTGYLYTMSTIRNLGINTNLRELYDPSIIIGRFLRYMIPYIPIFILEQVVSISKNGFSFIRVVKEFIYGGLGPGGYYIPIVIQLVILFPLIFIIIREKPAEGLVSIFIINAAYELVKEWIEMGGWI